MAFVLLGMGPLFAYTLWVGVQERRVAAEAARAEARRIARVQADELLRIMEGVRQLLSVLSTLPALTAGSEEDRVRIFRRLLDEHRQYANIGLIDPGGRVIAAAVPVSPMIPDAAPPLHFRGALDQRAFTVGSFEIRSSTGIPVLSFGYPLLGEDGEVRGVLFALLDLAWVSGLTVSTELPEGSTVTIFDQKGTVLLRRPDSDRWVGRSAATSEVFRAIQAARAGGKTEGTAEAAGLDDHRRLYAFTLVLGQSGENEASLLIGIPIEVAYRNADDLVRRSLVLLGGCLVLGMALAAFFGERVVIRMFGHLLEQANTDPLTRAATRRRFAAEAEMEIARAQRFRHPLSVIMMDLDHFKRVNDQWGHGAGDDVLVETAARCRAVLREADVLGRHGGEEFSILLPEAGPEEALVVGERLRAAIANAPMPTRAGQVAITGSFGVATARAETGSLQSLLGAADKALYAAKESGRNRVVAADSGPATVPGAGN